MGRQIHFHMLPEDQAVFLRLVQERDSVVVITKDSDSAKVQPSCDLDLSSSSRILCLWNRTVLPHLERKWVADPGYYRVDGLNTPTLEFAPSFTATWAGRPALGQGRLFGNFESYLRKPAAF